jgi:hypothetical protein
MSDKKVVVVEDVALQEFERFGEEMGLDFDESAMSQDDLGTFRPHKRRIVRAIMDGALIFNESGEPIYSPQNKRSGYQEPITLHERSGASLLAMDTKKQDQVVHKMYAMLAHMAGIPMSAIAGLKGEDIKVLESLFALLMA